MLRTLNGFPIGGVAAFDLDEGVISPGGVGYDINCLTENAKIPSPYGWFLPVQKHSFANVMLTVSGNTYLFAVAGNYSLVCKEGSSAMEHFMYREHEGGVFAIKTDAGEVECTTEHPIYTVNGRIKAGETKVGEQVLALPFEGVEYAPLYGLEEDKRLSLTAKIFGYLLGDGTVYRSGKKLYAVAYGAKPDLEKMGDDLRVLGHSAKLHARVRTSEIDGRRFTGEHFELHIHSQEFVGQLVALGMPLGNKTEVNFPVPEWVMQGPLWLKRQFLAGYFGAEMSKPKSLSRTCFYMPVVTMTKTAEMEEDGRHFMLQVSQMLEELGITVAKVTVMERGVKVRLRLMINGTPKNLINLYSKVGFEYNEKRKFLGMAAILYLRKKERETARRKELAKWVKEKRKAGFGIGEIKRILAGEINERFVERAFYDKAGTRLASDFPSFTSFAKSQLVHYEKNGALVADVYAVEKRQYRGKVYDFTVARTHNFVANGIVVSNCGVRMLTTGLKVEEVRPKLNDLVKGLFQNVPSGVGSKGKLRVDAQELKKALCGGVEWAVEKGYGWKEDIERCEENGRMEGADPSAASDLAIKRGLPQFGTLGAGNHFLEVQEIREIKNKQIAEKFGLVEGEVTVMIHCGSRGFGHQVCDDYIRTMLEAARKYNIELADRELCCAPVKSPEAEQYMKAMRCAVNYAFTNRHIIMHWVRETFGQTFGKGTGDNMKLIYDVAHNIAKIEEHEVDGKKRELCVHRKGATRAFAAGRKELPAIYRETGQPVLIPGSMGTASYILVGKEAGMKNTFGSTCHGAGRVMSRHEAIRSYEWSRVKDDLGKKGITLWAADKEVISEEAPGAYKDIDEVVRSVELAGISEIVAKLVPVGVVKG